MQHFDVLMPGFGRKSPPIGRPNPESSWSSRPRAHTSKMTEDPFVVLGSASPHVASSSNKTGLNNSRKSTGQTASSPINGKGSMHDTKTQGDTSPWSEQNVGSSDEVWLSVSEIPLFTQPTNAPPPSRPPPPMPARIPKTGSRFFGSKSAKQKTNESSSLPNPTQRNHSSKSIPSMTKVSSPSAVDELEKFARGSSPNNPDDLANGLSGEEQARNSDAAASSAAMKAAMDRAEAKFRHAREVRGRESTKAARSKDAQLEKDENVHDSQEQAFKEKQREEEEREQRRLEKERERARELERERARQAVERATREARERAAAEARLRAERAALEKANTEVRERAERAAVQRAQAEARERAANEAKERAEKAAAEAREREAREKAAEARVRAERAAVQRAAADVRQRATAEARQKEAAAGASRASQHSNDNDLDAFFKMGSHASTAPRPRASSLDPEFDTKTERRQGPEAAKTSAATSFNVRKASSTANLADDLSSLFGGGPAPSGEFQEVKGESEERRRARLERHQRTQERTAKALAEKNQRDLQTLKEQEERHRIAETLDVEIMRWAAGKEGNLRALLSTLQYVLWPDCGWEPVSLTDLITAASVKKVYRKATLCIHPDKVQQKGANLQQKYIAEKVFDLLKEAWNKFNSEELF
ncbi:auxilin-related protein 2-like isoform X2 [Rhodamnia argentea]|uniref:Auxilin-related protein 2-like isoform X2 n=1 Tax=Rhodamnia argentea TaxID=178133 RepID=A0ABM3GV43_9MYRT|nr:auxilin-related protein 2-like isoform X2 [Rhodamnia argentea]